MPDPRSNSAVILFAHGARDPRWAEPFHRVAAAVRAAAPELPVELAFLELMAPDLATAARSLAGAGATRIRIVPLFFGQGAHLRNDVPAMVADIAASMPGITLDLAPAAGDDEGVVQALAAFCRRQANLFT